MRENCFLKKRFFNGTPISATRMISNGLLTVQDRNQNTPIVDAYDWGPGIGGGIGERHVMQKGCHLAATNTAPTLLG